MSHYLLFLLVSFVIIATPGPDFALVAKNSLLVNSKGGRATTYGIVTGHFIHTIAFVFGVSTIIAKSVILFEIVKYVGAAYLLYLGIQSLLSKPNINLENEYEHDTLNSNNHSSKIKTCYTQGVISTAFNPKALIFYLTFFPQFISLSENVLIQSLTYSGIFILLVFSWFLLCVLILKYIRSWFKKPIIQVIFERITGLVLISLGLKLAFDKR